MTGVPAAEIALAVPPLLTTFQPSRCSLGGELDDACLVVHGEQRSGHVSTVGDRGYSAIEAFTRCTVREGLEFVLYLEAHVDLSKFKTSDWLKIGGAIGFFIFGFFNWVTVDGPAGSVGRAAATSSTSSGPARFRGSSSSRPVSSPSCWLTGTMKAGSLPWPLIMLVATGLAALLLLIRLIFNPLDGSDALESAGGSVGRGIGMILSVISGLVAFAGAFLGFKESGGDFNDLKDMNKLKASFQGGGARVRPAAPAPAARDDTSSAATPARLITHPSEEPRRKAGLLQRFASRRVASPQVLCVST